MKKRWEGIDPYSRQKHEEGRRFIPAKLKSIPKSYDGDLRHCYCIIYLDIPRWEGPPHYDRLYGQNNSNKCACIYITEQSPGFSVFVHNSSFKSHPRLCSVSPTVNGWALIHSSLHARFWNIFKLTSLLHFSGLVVCAHLPYPTSSIAILWTNPEPRKRVRRCLLLPDGSVLVGRH